MGCSFRVREFFTFITVTAKANAESGVVGGFSSLQFLDFRKLRGRANESVRSGFFLSCWEVYGGVFRLFFPPLFHRTWGAGFAYFTAQQEIMNTEYLFFMWPLKPKVCFYIGDFHNKKRHTQKSPHDKNEKKQTSIPSHGFKFYAVRVLTCTNQPRRLFCGPGWNFFLGLPDCFYLSMELCGTVATSWSGGAAKGIFRWRPCHFSCLGP